MQRRVHDYVVADKGTAKEALDQLVEDWNKVFKEEVSSDRFPWRQGLNFGDLG